MNICRLVTGPAFIHRFDLLSCKEVQIFVASAKELKKNAALSAIESVVTSNLENKSSLPYRLTGYAAASQIKEQPYYQEMTIQGAQNRIADLYRIVFENELIDPKIANDNVLRFYVAFENGIHKERVIKIPNPKLFETSDGKVWVDRCSIICNIHYNTQQESLTGISDGVTVPLAEVEASQKTDWNVTSDDFIAENYKVSSSLWHLHMAGKSRENILRDGLVCVLKHN